MTPRTLPTRQIAETEALEEGVRGLAAEFLVTLCEAREKAPGMMRKLPQVGRLRLPARARPALVGGVAGMAGGRAA